MIDYELVEDCDGVRFNFINDALAFYVHDIFVHDDKIVHRCRTIHYYKKMIILDETFELETMQVIEVEVQNKNREFATRG